MNEVVIARYAENLDWVTQIPAGFSVHLYNKGAPVTSPAVVKRIDRITDCENTGRESGTYLRHIAGMGPPSDGYVVFVQGDPFEHSPDFIKLLQAWTQWADVQPLSWRWKLKRDIPPTPILQRETSDFIDGLRVRPEIFSLQNWGPLGFYDAGTLWLDTTYRSIHGMPEGTSIASHFLRKCGCDALAAQADAHLLGRFSYGAVFAARQSRLATLQGPSLDLLRKAALNHQVYGYVLERLWLHLFGEPFVLPAPELPGKAAPPEIAQPGFIPLDRRRPSTIKLGRLARRISRTLARS